MKWSLHSLEISGNLKSCVSLKIEDHQSANSPINERKMENEFVHVSRSESALKSALSSWRLFPNKLSASYLMNQGGRT